MKSFFAKTILWIPLLFLLLAGSALSEGLYIIETDRMNLREKPDLNARIVKVLNKGEMVQALAKEKDWLKVRSDGVEGYLLNKPRYVRAISSLEEGQKRRSALEEQIRREKKNVEEYRKKEMDAVSELDRIDKTLQDMNRKLAAIRKDHQSLLQKRKGLLATRERLERENREKKQLIASRLRALYKLEATGHAAFFAETQNVYDFAVQKKALQEILNMDDRILGEQTARIREIQELSEKLKKEEVQIAAAAQKEAGQLRLQAAEKKKREELIAHVHDQQKKGLSNLSSLEKAAKNLDQTIDRLTKEQKKPERTPVISGPDSFATYRGKLDMPVAGQILSRFGEQKASDMNIKLFNKGMGIAAKTGDPIRALFSGTVIYADWLNAYGNMIILDHGDQYYSVYAHADALLKNTGDKVERNEVIASVGETGSMNGPMLYFEIREKGKAINPEPWLKKT